MSSHRTMRTGRLLAGMLAITLATPTIGVAQPSPAGKGAFIESALIKTEADSLGSFVTRLGDYDAKVKQVRATKGSPLLPQLRSQADQLKSATPTAQRDIRSIVDKLQRAGKWTAELDTYVIDQLKKAGADPRGIALIQSEGGARAVLTTVQNQLPTLNQDIDADLKDVSATAANTTGLPGLVACETVYAGRAKCLIFVAAAVACAAIDALPCTGLALGKAIDCAMTAK
jgi:hypothetical protein